MGNSSSQSVKNYVTNSTKYSQITSEQLNLANKADVSSYNMQNFTLLNGTGCPDPSKALIDCKNFKIGQTIDQEVNIVQEIDSEVAEKMANKLNAQAQTDIAAAMDQIQELDPGWFGEIMNSTRQELETKVKNEVENSVTSETVMDITNEVLADTINEQEETVSNCGTIRGEYSCDMGQDIANKITVSNILSNLVDKVSENETTSDFYTKATEQLSQEQEGVVGTIGDIFKELKWFFIIGAIVLGLILVVFIIYKLSSGGRSQQGFPYQFPPQMMAPPRPMPQPQPIYQQPQPNPVQSYAQAQQYSQPVVTQQ